MRAYANLSSNIGYRAGRSLDSPRLQAFRSDPCVGYMAYVGDETCRLLSKYSGKTEDSVSHVTVAASSSVSDFCATLCTNIIFPVVLYGRDMWSLIKD